MRNRVVGPSTLDVEGSGPNVRGDSTPKKQVIHSSSRSILESGKTGFSGPNVRVRQLVIGTYSGNGGINGDLLLRVETELGNGVKGCCDRVVTVV